MRKDYSKLCELYDKLFDENQKNKEELEKKEKNLKNVEAFYQAEINSLKKKLGQQKLPPMKFMGKKNERKLNVDKKSSNNKENEKGQEKMSS